MPQRKTCLDLLAGHGGFSSAFQAAEGWDVVTVDDDPTHDPDVEADIGTLQASDPRLPDAPDVVLASPPCRTFSKAAGWVGHYGDDGETPATDDARDAIVLARHAQGLIEALDPEYYVIENPEGSKLKQLFGPPD